jgi:hypothetical protein
MKIYNGLFIVVTSCLLSCDEINDADASLLVSQINNYCDKIDVSTIKKSFSKMIVKTAPIGNNTLNTDDIIDDITNETSKYLKDVAKLISSGKEKNTLNKSLKNTFSLYKKTIEEDIPKLSNGGNKISKLNMSESDIDAILLQVKQKNNQIVEQLHKIEKEALSKTDKLLDEN